MVYDPNKFKTAAPAIATFQAEDLIDGTGRATYFPTVSIDSSGTTYHLVTEAQPSALPSLLLTAAGNININCDLTPFNQPRTITGIATLSIAIGADNQDICNVSAQIQKLDSDSVETNISSVITSLNFEGNVTIPGKLSIQLFMQIPVTETLFAQGDTLRLNLIFTKTNATDGAEMGIDPTGLDSRKGWIVPAANTTTKTQLNVSFLNDL